MFSKDWPTITNKVIRHYCQRSASVMQQGCCIAHVFCLLPCSYFALRWSLMIICFVTKQCWRKNVHMLSKDNVIKGHHQRTSTHYQRITLLKDNVAEVSKSKGCYQRTSTCYERILLSKEMLTKSVNESIKLKMKGDLKDC